MTEAVSMIAGVTIFLSGWLVGRFTRRAKVPPQPKPVCGCGHHRALHDERGVCHASVQVPIKWSDYGAPTATKWENKPCVCQKYVGPIPVFEAWTPPMFTSPEDL